jgi:hypothetical protein
MRHQILSSYEAENSTVKVPKITSRENGGKENCKSLPLVDRIFY